MFKQSGWKISPGMNCSGLPQAPQRRQVLKGMAALAGTCAVGLYTKAAWAQSGQLVFVNWGGDAITAMDKAFGQPYTATSGIKVIFDGTGPTEGAIIAQAESGKPTWDLVDCDPFSGQALGKKGFMEPIDYSVVDRSKTREGFGWEYAASSYFYSYVIAYDSTKFATPPTSMADFFDTETFPGKRALYKWGVGVWEAALLADGVAPQDLYPLDLDRAHAKLKAFKPHIGGYWGGGAESQSLLMNGDVSMAIIWSTRASVLAKDSEGDIAFIWQDGLIVPGSTGVLKNSPGGKAAAMAYIASAQDPAQQVELFRLMGNGPANPQADALLSPEEKALNPIDPENAKYQTALNTDWYEAHYGAALDAYLALISS